MATRRRGAKGNGKGKGDGEASPLPVGLDVAGLLNEILDVVQDQGKVRLRFTDEPPECQIAFEAYNEGVQACVSAVVETLRRAGLPIIFEADGE